MPTPIRVAVMALLPTVALATENYPATIITARFGKDRTAEELSIRRIQQRTLA